MLSRCKNGVNCVGHPFFKKCKSGQLGYGNAMSQAGKKGCTDTYLICVGDRNLAVGLPARRFAGSGARPRDWEPDWLRQDREKADALSFGARFGYGPGAS